MRKILSIAIVFVLLFAFVGCNSSQNANSNTTTGAESSQAGTASGTTAASQAPLLNLNLVLYSFAQPQADNNDAVWEEINEKLKATINTTVTVKYVDADNYPLLIASNDNIDIVWTADWMNFWEYSQAEAFNEITDDMLASCKTGALALNEDFMDVGKLNGKRYMVPLQQPNLYNWFWLVRGDLMKKYNVPPIKDLKSLGVYLDAVARNEKGIIPFDLPGSDAWVLPSVYVNEARWVAPGQVNCTSPFFSTLDDPKGQLFYSLDAPETLAFSEMMKVWQENGYWSKTAMSSKVTNLDSFKAGTSATAWASALDDYYQMSQDPQYESWQVTAYPMYQYGFSGSRANQGFSIYNKCQDPQRALDVIRELIYNKEINRLCVYGQEGINYSIDSDGSFLSLLDGKQVGAYAALNQELKIPSKVEIAYPDLMKYYADSYTPSVISDFVLDNKDVKDIQAKLGDIWAQYGVVRCMGFAGDVKQALETEKKQQVAAGVEKYKDEVQKQLDAYLATIK